MDLESLQKVRNPKPYTPIDQVPLGKDTHSGWGEPVVVPKGARKELETNYASLSQEKHELHVRLRKVLREAAKAVGKAHQRREQVRTMTGGQTNSSKKLKPFVDPQIRKGLEEPIGSIPAAALIRVRVHAANRSGRALRGAYR
jgi:hypothetical protein